MFGHYEQPEAFGALTTEPRMIPAPPGTDLGPMTALTFFSEIATALGLQKAGVFTPWATRQGDVTWEEIRSPDTNLVLFALTDPQIAAAEQAAFGNPLPFVGVVTSQALSESRVAEMWQGTAYRPYETQAIYSQTDPKEPPTALYLHWGERIDLADLPRQVLAIVPRAKAMAGDLVFAAQVPREGTTSRGAPAMSFEGATLEAPRPVPTAAPPAAATATTASAARPSYAIPVAVGLGAAALGYFLVQQRKG